MHCLARQILQFGITVKRGVVFYVKNEDLRINKVLFKTELGEILGISQLSVSSYELGTREPTIEILAKDDIILKHYS